MSKALGAIGGDISLNFNGSQQQSQKSAPSFKQSNIGRASNGGSAESPTITTRSFPRATHRHHRKPESNLNHLLNFSYDRSNPETSRLPRRNPRSNPTFGRGSGHHHLDKAHFVNANFRFVVHPSGDYRINLSHPDLPIPWEQVLQVLASVESQCNACPICLEQIPVAPRMAKCGHVFCLPCVLRYLESADLKTGKTSAKWRKCPICFDSVYASEVRPVRWLDSDGSLPVRGQDVTLQLIRRKVGTTFALPRDAEDISDDVVPWHNQEAVLEHCHVVKGDAAYMTSEYDREITQLVVMQGQDEEAFGDGGQWTTTAIQVIEDAICVVAAIGHAPKRSPRVKETKNQRKPIEYTQSNDPVQSFVPASPGHTTIGKRDLPTKDDTLESASGDAYYFYQPRFGSHYYLAALDVRILKRSFHSFSGFPSALIAKVEHMTTVTADEELRRRSKYLSHLPLGCEITFLECDWSGILGDEVLELFKSEVEKRRKKRHDKAVSEESARRRAQVAEERRERTGLGELLWQDEDTSYFARNDESNTYDVFADDQHPTTSSVHSGSLPTGSLERTSVWGTAIPATEHQTISTEDDDQWKDKLEKFYEESAISSSLQDTVQSSVKKGKSKKKKLVLMSSGGGRGMG